MEQCLAWYTRWSVQDCLTRVGAGSATSGVIVAWVYDRETNQKAKLIRCLHAYTRSYERAVIWARLRQGLQARVRADLFMNACATFQHRVLQSLQMYQLVR